MRNNEETTAAKYSRLVSDLREAVLDGPGRIDPATRQSAAASEGLAEPWLSYTAKVRDQSWALTDSDIEDLKTADYDEDEIFEMTVAAAVGAALRMLDAGLRTLHGA